MNLKRSPIAEPPSVLIDAVMDGYVAWREQSAVVRDAYGDWRRAAAGESGPAYAAYGAALDREERAADAYRRLISLANGATLSDDGEN
jgi:hypothetical protein